MATSRVRLRARARARARGRREATLTELVGGAHRGRAHAHRRVCASQSKIVRHVGTPRLDLRTFSARTTRAALTLGPERRRQFAPACREPLAQRIGAHATLPETRCSKLYAQMHSPLFSRFFPDTLRFSGSHELVTPCAYIRVRVLSPVVHVWEHRRWALRHAVARLLVNLTDEARFVAALIGANFSNYSAWHHRSALLFLSTKSDRSAPASLALTWSLYEREAPTAAAAATRELPSTEIFTPRCPSHSIFLQLLRVEFELLQNAFFTDPSDQTAWVYYFWLLAFGMNTFFFVRYSTSVFVYCKTICIQS